MPKTITSSELQKQTRDAIDYARMERDAVIVETYGRPMAVLVGFDEYQDYLRYKGSQERRRTLFSDLREAAAANATTSNLTEDEAMQLVDEVRQEIYDENLASNG